MSRDEFQFTPLREGRLRIALRINLLIEVSIHAPARGATTPANAPKEVLPGFNSRPCERGDRGSRGGNRKRLVFQFTPLREGRLKK